MLYRIDLPYACFGLVVCNGQVTGAPPIARWTVGRSIKDVVAYYTRKGASVASSPDPRTKERQTTLSIGHGA